METKSSFGFEFVGCKSVAPSTIFNHQRALTLVVATDVASALDKLNTYFVWGEVCSYGSGGRKLIDPGSARMRSMHDEELPESAQTVSLGAAQRGNSGLKQGNPPGA